MSLRKTVPSNLNLFSFYVWKEKQWKETDIKAQAESKRNALWKMRWIIPGEFQKSAFCPSGTFTRLNGSYKIDKAGLGNHRDTVNKSPPREKIAA